MRVCVLHTTERAASVPRIKPFLRHVAGRERRYFMGYRNHIPGVTVTKKKCRRSGMHTAPRQSVGTPAEVTASSRRRTEPIYLLVASTRA